METANTSNNDARELRALRLSGTLDMDARNPDVVIPLSNEPEAKEGGFELAPPEQTVRAAVHREKDGDAASLAPSDFAKVAGPARSCFSFRPQLNQFFANGIYRSIGGAERKVTWEELFQDLLFVYLVRLVGEASVNSEAFGGENASRAIGSFVLLFYPVWISWFLTQLHVNQFYHETSAIYYRLAFLFQSAVVAGLGSVIPTVLSTHDEIKGLGNPGKAFVTFICLGRAELILQTLVHAVALPRFAPSLLLRALALVIPMLFYVAWLASGFTHLQELWWTAVATDLVLVFVVIPIATDGMAFRPATNLGHWAERMGLFTLIVLGEEVSNVVFEQPPTFSFSILGFSLLGLHLIRTQSKLYDASSRGVTTHAIRRSWLWESQWNVVHFPLHGSIIAGAASLHQLASTIPHLTSEITASETGATSGESSDTSTRSYNVKALFIGSQICVLMGIAILELLHCSVRTVRGRIARLASYAIGSVVIAIPFMLDANGWALLGTANTAFSLLWLGWEEWDKRNLPRVEGSMD